MPERTEFAVGFDGESQRYVMTIDVMGSKIRAAQKPDVSNEQVEAQRNELFDLFSMPEGQATPPRVD